ncbi:MAG TPA: GNAT family N-acetyltransferase [Gaiellaceae bacterium]|nr:GNAT family N-acetyltransferase [Gaiellaceae bacterium]
MRQPGPDDLEAFALVSDHADRDLYDALAHWRAHGFGPWIVELDGEAVGLVEVNYAGAGIKGIAPDEVELGWAIAEEQQRRGLATEAVRAALADAWERVAPPWFVAYIRPDNAASMRVAEKLGMRREGEGLTRSGEPMLVYRLRPDPRGSDPDTRT